MQRAPSTARDGQSRSGFTGILETFCESCHGAVAASLVDEEGEAVDLASVPEMWDETDGYTIKLIAAALVCLGLAGCPLDREEAIGSDCNNGACDAGMRDGRFLLFLRGAGWATGVRDVVREVYSTKEVVKHRIH